MLFDYNFKYYNYRLVLYMVALSVIGILVVASASGQDSSTVTKQIIGIMAVSYTHLDVYKRQMQGSSINCSICRL